MKKPYLAEDVKCITIETDEKNPTTNGGVDCGISRYKYLFYGQLRERG